ncbi:MAG: hypothetical protein EXS05_19695 [Planctomycetaceae bacterium]|nr:hypothetical protein [Planctomycetaceae bacterium]
MSHPRPPTIRLPQRGPMFWVAAILLALAAWRLYSVGDADLRQVPPTAQSVDEGPSTEAWVKRAVDGDTLLLRDGQRVRLLGVDTPETKREGTPVQPWGPEAHDFTQRMVEGKKVRLQFDQEHEDKYGRVLAYVYIDDKLLNEELLREGLGHALLKHPYRLAMKQRFRQAEREARDAKLGIWSDRKRQRRK